MGYPPEHFAVERAVIGDHPHVIIAPPGHPLARRRGIPLRDAARAPFLLREPGSGTRDLLRRLFDADDLAAGPRMEIGSNETIKQAVMAGMGVALISAHTIAAEVRDGRLAVLDIQGLPVVRQWFAVRRAEKRLLPVAEALWDHLAEAGGRFLPQVATSMRLAVRQRRRTASTGDRGRAPSPGAPGAGRNAEFQPNLAASARRRTESEPGRRRVIGIRARRFSFAPWYSLVQ